MQVALAWGSSSTLTTAALSAIALIAWNLRRRYFVPISKILIVTAIIVSYDIISISVYLFFTETIMLTVIMIFSEEVIKFSCCKIMNLYSGAVRFFIGVSFGLFEIAIAKTIVVLFGNLDFHSTIIFILFCFLTTLMHGVTALYYTASRHLTVGVAVATAIHLLNNGISLQSQQQPVQIIAFEQISLLLIALLLYHMIKKLRFS